MNLQEEYLKKKEAIIKRLDDFKNVKNNELFYEMCFCLLTPQSTARGADRAIQVLKKMDFKNKDFNPSPYLEHNIRFHNNKARYMIELKGKYNEIKNKLDSIKDNKEKRNFLVKNVKGLGLKEAAHYLRNTGHENLAILDRHILKNLNKLNVIEEVPKTLTSKKYFEIEDKFLEFSKKINIPIDHLDLLFWSMEAGEIFK